ncbi:CinA family protein [Oceaniovalibus guishaninsula]|uniref:CinA family protein n=1 Tax=Oceaniovalibus guishaninsula TaxID=1046117 RepID=UPI00058F2917|nr:CinA family protein [Oceaniovalibus guishaninsula]
MSVPEILAAARTRRAMIATAESCTAGMIAATLTDPAGASDVFDCGFVTYSNAAKMRMLGVRRETLDTHGAVSEAVAHEMAQGALDRSQAALAVAVTGIAGPGGSEYKPEGRVCFALAGLASHVETVEFGAPGRSAVRHETVQHALALLLGALTQDGDQRGKVGRIP